MTDRPDIPERITADDLIAALGRALDAEAQIPTPESAGFATNAIRDFLAFVQAHGGFEVPVSMTKNERVHYGSLMSGLAPALRKQGAEEAEKRCKEVEVESAEMVDRTVDLWVDRLRGFVGRLETEVKSRMQRQGRNSSVTYADFKEAVEKAKAEVTALGWDTPARIDQALAKGAEEERAAQAERDRLAAKALAADLEHLGLVRCPDCDEGTVTGTETERDPEGNIYPVPVPVPERCPTCDGTGWRNQGAEEERERVEAERCESCEDTGIYEEGSEWTPCEECERGRSLVAYFRTARKEAREEEREWLAKRLEEVYAGLADSLARQGGIADG